MGNRVGNIVCLVLLLTGCLVGHGYGQSVMANDLKLLPERIESYFFVNTKAVSNEQSFLSLLPLDEMAELEEKRYRADQWSMPVFSSSEAAYKVVVYPGVINQVESVSVGIWNTPDLYTQKDYVVVRGQFKEDAFFEKLSAFKLRSTDQKGVYIYPTARPIDIRLRFLSDSVLLFSNDSEWISSVEESSLKTGEELDVDDGPSMFLFEEFEGESVDAAFFLDGRLFPEVVGRDKTMKTLLGPLTKSRSVCVYLLSGNEYPSVVMKTSYLDESMAGLGASYQRELLSLMNLFLQRYPVDNEVMKKEELVGFLEKIETRQKETDVFGRIGIIDQLDSEKVRERILSLLYVLRGNRFLAWRQSDLGRY